MFHQVTPGWLEEIGFEHDQLLDGDGDPTVEVWRIALSEDCRLELHPRPGMQWLAVVSWRPYDAQARWSNLPRMIDCRRHVVRLVRVLGGRIVKPRALACPSTFNPQLSTP